MLSFTAAQESARRKWAVLQASPVPVICLGTASCGRAAGAMKVLGAIEQTLAEQGQQATLVQVGCIGLCYLEPLLDITVPGRPRISYSNVNPKRAEAILASHLGKDEPLMRCALAYHDEDHAGSNGYVKKLPRFKDLAMLKPQVRVVLRNCGVIDPEDIDHSGGHRSLSGPGWIHRPDECARPPAGGRHCRSA
jgi:(2Fe-2S) ferredoxin